MRTQDDQVILSCSVGRLTSLKDYLLPKIAGRRVLNVGAVGTLDENILPDHLSAWSHARYAAVAAEIDAIDIDRTRNELAASHGYRIDYGNCETVDLGKRYDAIIMADVIEHVEQPGQALKNLVKHLTDEGTLFVATPNPGYVADMVRAALNHAPHVYWDHMALFAPEHIQSICDRHSLVLRAIYFYSEIDARSPALRAKSRLLRLAAALSPRLHQSFVAEIGRS